MKNKTTKLLIVLMLLVVNTTLQAKHLHKEKYYQNIICNKFKGQTEYTLKDKTRVDCLTSTLAIEVDFANKWAESIGQSLFYSLETNRRPTVVLITERKQKDIKYLRRLLNIAIKYNIRVYLCLQMI